MRAALHQFSEWENNDDQFLVLKNLAQDLKLPLTHIITQAHNNEAVITHAKSAVDLIDTYILCVRLNNGQQQLKVEPVLLKPLFEEVAQDLHQFASNRSNQFELAVSNKTSTVLSDRAVLKSTLFSLSYSAIHASQGSKNSVLLKAHKDKNKVQASVFSNSLVSKAGFLKSSKIGNHVSAMPYGMHAGIAIARNLSELIDSPIRPISKWYEKGITLTLVPSSQLALW